MENIQRAQFLDVLYNGVPDNLWLEIRCIHPTHKAVKILWMPVHRRYFVLDQADRYNAEGYGIYYGFGLRSRRNGRAESVALIPGLWTEQDCDNDPIKRAQSFNQLVNFTPKPSVVIDSGGGWHSYWLFKNWVSTTDETGGQRLHGILRGLFGALGGDPEYAKSIASLMRLPGTVNTKPERNHAPVRIIEFEPSRRYDLEDFVWLYRPTQQPQYYLQSPLSRLDHARLPKSTINYLDHGAPDRQRNTSLFNAACQFRDAGYSQSEAEGALLPRYLADDPEQNPSARERKGRRTIASAYSRSPRNPATRGGL